jgi:hypothetical protein
VVLPVRSQWQPAGSVNPSLLPKEGSIWCCDVEISPPPGEEDGDIYGEPPDNMGPTPTTLPLTPHKPWDPDHMMVIIQNLVCWASLVHMKSLRMVAISRWPGRRRGRHVVSDTKGRQRRFEQACGEYPWKTTVRSRVWGSPDAVLNRSKSFMNCQVSHGAGSAQSSTTRLSILRCWIPPSRSTSSER